MGKAKRARGRKSRPAPTGLPSKAEIEAIEDANSIFGGVQCTSPIVLLQQLSDPKLKKRASACVAIATVFAGDEMDARKSKLLQSLICGGVLRVLSLCLLDSNLVTATHAAGALRNISVIGGMDTCERMADEDVATPAIAILTKYGQGLKEILDKPSITEQAGNVTQIKQAVGLVHEVLHILLHLCEANGNVVKQITHDVSLVDLLFSLACSENRDAELHTKILVTVAKLLHVMSDDNPQLAKHVWSHPLIPELLRRVLAQERAPSASSMVALLLAGVIGNMSSFDVAHSGNAGYKEILQTEVLSLLTKVVSVDAQHPLFQSLPAVAKAGAFTTESGGQRDIEIDGDEQQKRLVDEQNQKLEDAAAQLHSWKELVEEIVLALEILTNVCALEDEDEDRGYESSDDWIDDDSDVGQLQGTGVASADGPESVALIAQLALYEKTKALMNLVASSSTYESNLIRQQFVKILSRCCGALTNMTQYLPVQALQDPTGLFSGLCALCESIDASILAECGTIPALPSDKSSRKALAEARELLLPSVIGTMASVLRRVSIDGCVTTEKRVAGSGGSGVLEDPGCGLGKSSFTLSISAAQMRLLGALATLEVSEEAQALAMAMLGIVGKCVTDVDLHLVQSVGLTLRGGLHAGSIHVVAEALDAIFDVFGDERWDSIFTDLQLLPALVQVHTDIKSKIKRDAKRLDHDERIQMKETQINLGRFIKYKRAHIKSVQ